MLCFSTINMKQWIKKNMTTKKVQNITRTSDTNVLSEGVTREKSEKLQLSRARQELLDMPMTDIQIDIANAVVNVVCDRLERKPFLDRQIKKVLHQGINVPDRKTVLDLVDQVLDLQTRH